MFPRGTSATIGSTILAQNSDHNSGTDIYENLYVHPTLTTFTSAGYNRADFDATNYFTGTGDHVGSAHYVVTGVADTYDGTSDKVVMSLRDAIALANGNNGVAETIWLPAWNFVLTRERNWGTHPTDMTPETGDLDVSDTLTVLGVHGSTKVAWRAGAAADRVFELLGDYNQDGVVDGAPYDVDSLDYLSWVMNGSDGDDDGIGGEADDYNVWAAHFGNQMTLAGITL